MSETQDPQGGQKRGGRGGGRGGRGGGRGGRGGQRGGPHRGRGGHAVETGGGQGRGNGNERGRGGGRGGQQGRGRGRGGRGGGSGGGRGGEHGTQTGADRVEEWLEESWGDGDANSESGRGGGKGRGQRQHHDSGRGGGRGSNKKGKGKGHQEGHGSSRGGHQNYNETPGYRHQDADRMDRMGSCGVQHNTSKGPNPSPQPLVAEQVPLERPPATLSPAQGPAPGPPPLMGPGPPGGQQPLFFGTSGGKIMYPPPPFGPPATVPSPGGPQGPRGMGPLSPGQMPPMDFSFPPPHYPGSQPPSQPPSHPVQPLPQSVGHKTRGQPLTGFVQPMQRQQQQQQQQTSQEEHQQRSQRPYHQQRSQQQASQQHQTTSVNEGGIERTSKRARQRRKISNRRNTSRKSSVQDGDGSSVIGEDDGGSVIGASDDDQDDEDYDSSDTASTTSECEKWPDLQLETVKSWFKMTPSEIKSELLKNTGSIKKVLSKRDVPDNMLTHVIRVMAKAFDENADLSQVVQPILHVQRFLKLHMPHHILSLRINTRNKEHEDLLEEVQATMKVLNKILRLASAAQAMDMNPSLVLLGDVLKDMESKNLDVPDAMRSLLQNCNDILKGKSDESVSVKKKQKKNVVLETPTSPFPCVEEVNAGKPPDITLSGDRLVYSSTEECISVQFQLLRELIAEPVRKHVAKCIDLYRKRNVSNDTLNEVPVFQHVTVTGIRSSKDLRIGLVYSLHFDVSPFNHVKWETSKHLVEGSIVVLSHDHFNRMIFGIVRERDPSELRQGKITLQIPCIEDVTPLLSSPVLYMIDSCADAGVLDVIASLQHLTDVTMPFYGHIISLDTPQKLPVFCADGNECFYDLSSLVIDDSSNKSAKAMATNVPLTDFTSWPARESTPFDESQMDAIKSALTHEFTAISGGPGTGKTFLSLKILEVLLRNMHRWGANLADRTGQHHIDSGPILIISYDEESLDHLLKGVLTFQDHGIIRFGAKSKDPELNKLNVDKLQKKKEGATASSSGEEQEDVRKKLMNVHNNIHVTRRTIVSAVSLKRVMSTSHFESITQKGGMMEWILPAKASKAVKRVHNYDDQIEGDAWVECPLNVEYDPEKHSTPTAQEQLEPTEKKQLVSKLRHTDVMKEKEVGNVGNVWEYSSEQRWRLYRLWIQTFNKTAARHIQDLCSVSNNIAQELAKGDITGFDSFRDAVLLGMTTLSAIEYHRVLRYVQPRIIIVDQATDIMESIVLATVSQNCRQMILVGDTSTSLKQHPAISGLARKCEVETSLFLRLLGKEYAVKSLPEQHRMRPEISKFLKLDLYPHLDDHANVAKLDKVKGIDHNVFFLSHGFPIDVASTQEVTFLLAFCEYLMDQGYQTTDLLILTVHPGQLNRFRKEIKNDAYRGIKVENVEDLQGESDIVMLAAFGIHQKEGQRLKKEYQMVKAISSARKAFYAIGNFTVLAERSNSLRTILTEAERLNWMGREMMLSCSNHSDQYSVVSSAEDIRKRISDGGCGRSCEARLRCGHSCKLPCHKHDNKKMGAYRCEQQCQKPISGCPAGHKCTNRCHEKCIKKCNKMSERKLACGHTCLVQCSLAEKDVKCQSLCGKTLPCGHPCKNTCGEPCAAECLETVTRDDWPCQHVVMVRCSDTQENCPYPCNQTLRCGHSCQGTCGTCVRGRLHVTCEKTCGRTLVCGHQCKSKCSTTCPPCAEDCQNKCTHSRCTEPCGDKCIPCLEHCEWQCPHQSCRQVCSQPCDREPCKQPCRKKLKCGHECIGLCGEPCPKKCRECDESEVKETFFGNEDEPDARFVQLEDCGHILEVSGLDRWMTSSAETDDSKNIKLKCCPKCSTPIRKHLRYGNAIKRTLADIEVVKEKMMGNRKEIKENKRRLRKMGEVLKKSGGDFLSEDSINRLLANLDNCHHLETVVARLNRCNFLQEEVALYSRVDALCQSLQEKSAGKKMPKAHHDILEHQLKPFENRLGALKKRLSEGDLDRFAQQQTDDVMTEIIRIRLEVDAAELLVNHLTWWDQNPGNQQLLIEFGELTATDNALTLQQEDEAKEVLARIREALGISEIKSLSISDRERMQVVHAIGLSQGHWFKCKKGHVYAIGECGGAMEHGVCPECGETIGGQRHRLQGDNQLASEMDNAKHAAWSKEA